MDSLQTILKSDPMIGPMPQKTKLLVIDDDSETIDLLKIILEPNDFDVITTTSGCEGVQLARKLKPDIMIVDLLMPDLDGLNVCREVRKFSQVPILVLSAVGKPGMATQALDEGADDYLIKPMNYNLLVASLKKLTRRARAEKEALRSNGRYRMV